MTTGLIPQSAALTFQGVFGAAPTHAASAPGRVNLIGDHTDYHGGYVLPLPIPQRTHVLLRLRQDERVRVISESQPEAGEPLEYRVGDEHPGRGWLDYVQGATHVLRKYQLSGFDLAIASDIPIGAGLSSSAALEVAVLRGLRSALGIDLDDFAIALLGRHVENDFVGVPSGVMDQLASSLSTPGSALFIDTRSLDVKPLAMPSELAVFVFGSGVSHRLASGEYAQRRRESEQAAHALGVRELRDLGPCDLARIEQLPQPLAGRARHIVTENHRVLQAVEALQMGEYGRLGELLLASHASLRDDYQVSTAELDRLVELAIEHGALGARMTGGGFGGSIVALVDRLEATDLRTRVLDDYAKSGGRSGFAFEVQAADRPDGAGNSSPDASS